MDRRTSLLWKLACSVLAVHLACDLLAVDQPSAASSNQSVLATVGDDKITEADLRLHSPIVNLPIPEDAKERDETRALLLDQIIERRLIQRFLKRQEIEPEGALLEARVQHVKDLIRRRKDDPDALMKRLGLTPAVMEDQLGLPLAWEAYVRLSITEKQVVGYFEKHRSELDGTKLRASQIILKLAPNAKEQDINERKSQLAGIRKDILAKKLTFADAAKKFSEAPSKLQGGDVGWFPFRGKMPIPFCDAAFALKTGDISEPVVSPFGVHLIYVTDRQPGDLTIDDVRTDVVERLSSELWLQAVKTERERSKVVIK